MTRNLPLTREVFEKARSEVLVRQMSGYPTNQALEAIRDRFEFRKR